MKNIHKLILASLITGTVFTSCKKSFLELAPRSNANADVFYKTTADFDLAVTNAYSTLYRVYDPEGPMSYCGELMSDNTTIYQMGGTFIDKWAIRDYTITPSNSMVYQFWSDIYTSLYHENIVLDKIEGASLNEDYKNRVRAEMRFLRGLYYFNLVRLFGDVPLVTTAISSGEAFEMTRTPAADVYNQIIEDLKYAGANLPEPGSEPAPGRATRGAAKTLLGEVYLTMDNKPAAKEVLMDVYTSYDKKPYDLLASFGALWGNSNAVKNSKESIFEIQYLGGVANPYSTYWTVFAPFENFAITKYGGGMNLVTDDLYNEYEAGDPRREISFFTGYQKNNQFVEIKFQKKWVDQTAQVDGAKEAANNNFMVLRYADLLLMLSEATDDPQYLNRVRARVGLPAFGTPEYPSAKYPTLALAIEHERRMELAIEFHRWFDLKRTGRAVAVLTAKGKPVNQDKLLLPIPQTARDQNNKLGQNKGYTE